MSKLTKFFHKHENVLHGTVEYLETVDIPNEKKRALAVSIMQVLHVSSGGVWDTMIESGVVVGIDYALATIRRYSKEFADTQAGKTAPPVSNPTPTPPSPPQSTSIYGQRTALPIPDDSVLLFLGFKSGDVKWLGGNNDYYILEAGTLEYPGSQNAGTIG